MKLYTRTGDDGTTSLFGGQRVGKDCDRVEAYGTVDELNSIIGLCLAQLPGDEAELRPILISVQNRLFELGSDLATPDTDCSREKAKQTTPRITQQQIDEVEGWIDAVAERTEPLKFFVLPGGTELAARLHLARTVARRAERLVLTLSRSEPVTPEVLVYLNRLSDLCFAMARRANVVAGVADVPWEPGTSGGDS